MPNQTDILTRLGLTAGATNEEIAYTYTRLHNCWIGEPPPPEGMPCQALAKTTPACANCRRETIGYFIALLAAVRATAKAEVWEAVCPQCTYRCHQEPPCCDFLCEHTTESGLPPCVVDEEDYTCPAGDAIAASFANCPLVAGKGGEG